VKRLYLVIGVPGAGKRWVCEQLTKKFTYVAKDSFIGWPPGSHVTKCIRHLRESDTPVLTEAQFSISDVKEPLEEAGFQVVLVFILEAPHVVSARYFKREGKEIPKGHLTRQNTYAERAREWRAFSGTSAEVLEHLKSL